MEQTLRWKKSKNWDTYVQSQIAYDNLKPLLNKSEMIILNTLRKTGRLCQKDLAADINKRHYMAQSELSRALHALIRAGVVKSENDGIYLYVQVDTSGIKRINRIASELANGY